MNDANDSLSVDCTLHALRGANAMQVYELLARQTSLATGVRESFIHSRLMEQERRATSGIGGGVAIPHLRLKKLVQPYTLLARLARPVDFNAVDGQPVDLVCLLLSPDTEIARHLQRLSRISRLLRDPALCGSLRTVASADGMAALLMETESVRRATRHAA